MTSKSLQAGVSPCNYALIRTLIPDLTAFPVVADGIDSDPCEEFEAFDSSRVSALIVPNINTNSTFNADVLDVKCIIRSAFHGECSTDSCLSQCIKASASDIWTRLQADLFVR